MCDSIPTCVPEGDDCTDLNLVVKAGKWLHKSWLKVMEMSMKNNITQTWSRKKRLFKPIKIK